jgi:hypothetical protein
MPPSPQAKPNFKIAIAICKKNGRKDPDLLYQYAIELLKEGSTMARDTEDQSAIARAADEALPFIKECVEIRPEDEKCIALLNQAQQRDPRMKANGERTSEEEIEELADKIRAQKKETEQAKAKEEKNKGEESPFGKKEL